MLSAKREHWGSSFGFIMAAAGSAIGLGNIWRFPYITGMNGGGAFVLVYLACILVVGLPVMLAELAIGRASQSDAIGAFRHFSTRSAVLPKVVGGFGIGLATALAYEHSFGMALVLGVLGLAILRWGWNVAGFFSSIVAMVILSYYSIIGGWILGYAVKAFSGGLNYTDSAAAGKAFASMAGSLPLNMGLTLVFLLGCAAVCWFGVKKGLEQVSKFMVPLLFILVLILVFRGITLPGAEKGVDFFLKPDFGKLSRQGVLEAMGHSFFSLSLGMGIIITYGGYLPRDRNILKSAVTICALDTLIAILAGLAIFPAVFAMGFREDQGTGLLFNILPAAFNSIPGGMGWLWSGLFFLLMLIAAGTSGMSLLEVGTATAMEHLKLSRHQAVVAVTGFVGIMALAVAPSVLGWGRLPWAHDFLVAAFGGARGSLLDLVDNICSNWVLPLNGLAVAVFVGWIWGTRKAARELYRRGAPPPDENSLWRFFHLQLPVTFWGFFIRFIAPVLVLIIFLSAAGFFNLNK